MPARIKTRDGTTMENSSCAPNHWVFRAFACDVRCGSRAFRGGDRKDLAGRSGCARAGWPIRVTYQRTHWPRRGSADESAPESSPRAPYLRRRGFTRPRPASATL